jgi:hypothetical protein
VDSFLFALGPLPLLDSASIAISKSMSSESEPSRVLYHNLDTSFVNLWGLLRYLSQRSFIGRVHVELENYTADVFLNGSKTPLVHEVDRAAGSDVVEEAALHRLVLRVRESPGSISVYEGADEAVAPQSAAKVESGAGEPDSETETPTVLSAPRETQEDEPLAATPELMRSTPAKDGADVPVSDETQSGGAAEWSETLRASGELIGGVERAVVSGGGDFASLFREVRIGLSDDYTFLDPMSGQMLYESSAVTLNTELPARNYVAGISEALRRVVDQLATGDRARRTRERVALELARIARKNDDAMTRSGFKAQLDRIAGTKVI